MKQRPAKKELFKYYLREMPNRGYQLFMNGDYNIIFKNSDELVVIVVPPSPQSGKMTFMVSTASMKILQEWLCRRSRLS